jgi:hypothetical protein
MNPKGALLRRGTKKKKKIPTMEINNKGCMENSKAKIHEVAGAINICLDF